MQFVSTSPSREPNISARSAGFWIAVAIILAAMATLQVVTVRRESQIYDESNQLLSGYTYLNSGRFTLGLEHPPLLKLLWAVPVAMLGPTPPPPGIPVVNPWPAGRVFLYHNRVSADTMLMAGRSMAIAISLLLGLVIAFWTRREFGMPAALFAVILYACDPNFLANGRYIKNDVGAALMIFTAVMTWGMYLTRPTGKTLAIAGVVLGLALVTKFSAVVLLPLMPILYLIRRWQNREPLKIAAFLWPLAAAIGIASLIVVAVYGFEVQRLGDSGVFRTLLPHAPAILSGIPFPALNYIRGFGEIGLMQTTGSSVSYLLGRHSQLGWWYMSPVAFLVKTPLAELTLFLLATICAAVILQRARWRNIGFRWFLLAIPPILYFGVSLLSNFHAGLRHLLPIYPFLFVLAAGVLFREPALRWKSIATVACVTLLIAETASVHPHYLAFFNILAGGPVGGRRYLVDSNLDWGQDAKNLKVYLDAHGIPEICVDYFGIAELDYYGIRSRPLTILPDESAVRDLNCVAVISVTNLMLGSEKYAGLALHQPIATIGHSIDVYDLRKERFGLVP